jgi:hypothetical protein
MQRVWSTLSAVNVFVYGNENSTTARTLNGLISSELVLHSPSFFTPAASSTTSTSDSAVTLFNEVATLSEGRALLQIDGENPDDANGAVVVRYQMGLRDNCKLHTRTVLNNGVASASPPPPRFMQSESESRVSSFTRVGMKTADSSRNEHEAAKLIRDASESLRTGRLMRSEARALRQATLGSNSDGSAGQRAAGGSDSFSNIRLRSQGLKRQYTRSAMLTPQNEDVDAILARIDSDHAFRLLKTGTELFAHRRGLRRLRLASLPSAVAGHPMAAPFLKASQALTLSHLSTAADFEAAATRGLLRRSGDRWLCALQESLVPQALAELHEDCALHGAAVSMLLQLLQQPAFDVLRTQQQLGYIVALVDEKVDTRVAGAGACNVTALLTTPTGGAEFAGVRREVLGDIMQSIVLVVQGTSVPPHLMDAAAAAFIDTFGVFLADLDLESWRSAVSGVQALLRHTPLSMPMAFSWEWEEVLGRSFRPKRRNDESQALTRVRLEHVVALYRSELVAQTRRSLSVEVFGRDQARGLPTGSATASVIAQLP